MVQRSCSEKMFPYPNCYLSDLVELGGNQVLRGGIVDEYQKTTADLSSWILLSTKRHVFLSRSAV